MPAKPDYVRIADAVTAAILEGRLKPGDKLPSINEMTTRYEVSATTFKMALIRLEARLLIRRHQGKGIFIQPREKWLLPPEGAEDEPTLDL